MDTGCTVAYGYKMQCGPWIQDTVLPIDTRCTVTQGSGQMIQDILLPVIEGALWPKNTPLPMNARCTVDTVAYGYRMHCWPWYRMH